MPTSSSKNRRLASLLFGLILLVAAIFIAYAFLHSGPWIVPDSAKALKNPVPLSDPMLQDAHKLYEQKCEECHGAMGEGDGPQARQHDPRPTNLADESLMSTRTDGELFYKISRGHRPMPGFEKRLTVQQRWELVWLIRSFSGGIPDNQAEPGPQNPVNK